MGELTARRWSTTDGQRLLVTIGDVPIGWYCLETGETFAVDQSRAGAVLLAVEQWRLQNPPQGPSFELPAPGQRDLEVPQRDLSSHVPGQLAMERSELEYRGLQQRNGRLLAWSARTLDLKTDERAWRVGARGEQRVGRILNKLRRRGFAVLHSLPVGDRGADIDHLVIGPPGVFTVNTKTHPDARIWVRTDTVKVNGHNRPYVRVARYEARRAQQRLAERLGWQVGVTGMLVFVSAERVTVKKPPADVKVREPTLLPTWFRLRGQMLSREQVREVYEVARRLETWS